MITPKTTCLIHKTAHQSCRLALLGLLAITAPAFGNETVFGSDNDGYGGFTAAVTTIAPTPAPGWELTAGAARFTNNPATDSGQVNSSLLQQIALDRTDGSSYTMTGIVEWTSTYAADNNRLAISLFRTSDLETSFDTGLTLLVNVGAASNQLQMRTGYNGTTVIQASLSGVTSAQLIGQTLTYVADMAFVGSDIEIDFTLSAPVNSYSQTISATVAQSSFAGEYFGFSARGRVRKATPGVNDIPFIYDAKSFSVVNMTPPPAGPPVLVLTPNTVTPGNYDFTWTSQAGKVYDIVTSTDLSTAIATWPVWDDQEGLPATPPNNVLANVPGGGDTRRFFAVVERDAPASP